MILFQAARLKSAIIERNHDALRRLLEKGANPNACEEFGRTPLELAVLRGEVEMARMLIEAKADPEARWYDGTQLMQAVESGYQRMTALLLEKYPDMLHQKNSEGDAPLHMAARKGHAEITAMLIDAGADATLKNGKNRTPLYLAQANNHNDVVAILGRLHDTVPLPPPPMPQRVQAEAGGAADQAAGKWHVLAPDRIAHIVIEDAIQYRITEIFNFATRERTRIYQNLQTRAESAETRGFDDIAERTPLARALGELQARGGTVPADAIEGQMPGKSIRRPSSGP